MHVLYNYVQHTPRFTIIIITKIHVFQWIIDFETEKTFLHIIHTPCMYSLKSTLISEYL